MEEATTSGFVIGIELIINAIIIAGFVVIMSQAQKGFDTISEQQAMTDELREYRVHNQYDGTVVYPQDIISAIYRYRGTPAVYVLSSKGAWQWTETNAPCEWNTAAIAELMDQTVMYDAALVLGANGEVIAYEFKSK